MPLDLKKTTQEVLEYLISGVRVTKSAEPDQPPGDDLKAHHDEVRLHAKPPPEDPDPFEPA